MYHFQSLGGGDAPGSSHSGGVVESGGQHNLFAEVFKLGATPMYLATFMEKKKWMNPTARGFAVTNSSLLWAQVIFIIVITSFCIVHSKYIIVKSACCMYIL